MDLNEAIYSRRSVREFTAETVSEIIRDLIEAAVQAPSAVNAQPCTFCVIRDKTVLVTISQEAVGHMVETTPVGLMSHHFKEILNDPNFTIPRTPNFILIQTHRRHSVGGGGLRALRRKPTPVARGVLLLGTCWIGFAQSWLGTLEGKALLNLSANYKPVAPIIVGQAIRGTERSTGQNSNNATLYCLCFADMDELTVARS